MPDRTPTGLPYPLPTDQVAGLPATFRELVELIATNIQPTGLVAPFAGVTAPAGWLLCDGTDYARADYPELFAVVGIAYTPNAAEQEGTRFRVPDLRGRTIVGTGPGNGLTPRARGAVGGAEAVSLTVAQLPSHNHTGTTGNDAPDHNHGPGQGTAFLTTSGGANVSAGSGIAAAQFTPGTTGGASVRHAHSIPSEGDNAAHDNMPPFLAAAYIIRT